jgi:hypothetical protein
VGRHPLGSDRQNRTDTALFGHIAYKLEGVRLSGLEGWAEDLGILVGTDALRKAPENSLRLQGRPQRRSALRASLTIDWSALNLFSAVVRLRIADRNAIAQLERVTGVVDLYGVAGGQTAVLVVVYERLHDQEALKRRLSEFGEMLDWDQVESHRPDAVIRTSRAFAREAAQREGLLGG